MKKSGNAEKRIKEIDNTIQNLKDTKKKIIRHEEKIYCPVCQKFYSSDKCRQGPEMSGSFLEAWHITCPKGHTWDDK